MTKFNSHRNLEYIDTDGLTTEVEGRAVHMKLLIDDIIREDPKLVKNQANIKRKLKERLKKSNKYSAYVLEEDNIKNLIRS